MLTNTKHLRYFITTCLLLLALSSNAKTIKLNFEPTGKIIKFYFDSLIIYTDTASLFYIYRHDKTKGFEIYDQRVRNLVLRQFNDSKTDTATFRGDNILFNDGIDNKYQRDWYIEWAILDLLQKRRLKIYDKHGQLVKTIVTKKVGSRKELYIRRDFINKATKEILLSEVLFSQSITPVF